MFYEYPRERTPAVNCMIACRSVTYAQKYAKLLRHHGMPVSIRRLPSHITEAGCGHAVTLREAHIPQAAALLRENGMERIRVWCESEDGQYKEMAI